MLSSEIKFRVDDHVKNEALVVIRSAGLSMSVALRMFLAQVASQKRIPLDIIAAIPVEILEARKQWDAAIKNDRDLLESRAAEALEEHRAGKAVVCDDAGF